jgi:ribosomal protein S18 acetylase RimI-like enzyme
MRDRELIELTEAVEADNDFLYSVYASTRSDEVKSFGWEESQAEAFLRMQYAVRVRSYETQYPGAITYVVLYQGDRAGSMILDRGDARIAFIDVAILAEFQGKGIGTHLFRMHQREAAAVDKPVDLMVEKTNSRAIKLYLSLGFVVTGEVDFWYSMQWKA